ncbi:cytochrome P450 81D1-like [Momordica charantia]|uniref:Cytochrome P450 81D1-like n=1 Tax=Momordica charantia TaxID=3673 RepID=A0A6J1D737_MOMCH|nr:cytochrome P450 81D1-like [Momordica charantia]
MAVAPYGDHWRNLRRIGALEIFSTTRMNLFSGIREGEVKRLMRKRSSLVEFTVVEPGSMILDLMFNIIMRMVAGKKYYEDDMSNDGKSRKFREVVKEIMAHGGATNPGDFIPIWNWIDPTGLEKKIMKLGNTMDELLQELIDEIRNQKGEGNTMIEHLLPLQKTEPENHSDLIIKGLIQIILVAGIDTTGVTLEWTLSHLLNNPEVLEKAKTEIDNFVGQERLVNEADLSSLSYVQGIISETLRLTPAAPLLVPHCPSEDCKIGGYDVPRDAIVLINAWAIHRDPELWEDATSFKPERHPELWEDATSFKPERHTNAIGVDSYKLLPFGLGRRACPGMGMAQRVAVLTLASLIQCFEWKRVSLTLASLIQCFEWKRVSCSLVDMTEGEGITMPKAQPLIVKCRPRPIMRAILNQV